MAAFASSRSNGGGQRQRDQVRNQPQYKLTFMLRCENVQANAPFDIIQVWREFWMHKCSWCRQFIDASPNLPAEGPPPPYLNMPGSQIRRKFAGHEEFSQPPQIYLNTLPCLEGKNPETFTRIGLCSEPWIWFAKHVKCEPTMFNLEKNCGRKKQGRRMTSNEHDSLFPPPPCMLLFSG